MPTTAQHTFEPSTIKLDPMYPNGGARLMNVRLADGTYAKGTILGEVTATPGLYGAYATADGTGLGLAKVILQYSCVSASQVVTIAGEHGQTQRGVPVYTGGGAIFRTQDLVGLDAAGAAEMGAVVIQGDLTTGLVRF